MITSINEFRKKNEAKEMDDNLSADIFMVKKDELIPIDTAEWTVDKVVDVITDLEQIKKFEGTAAVYIKSTNLDYKDVTDNSVIYITCMLKPKNNSTAYPTGQLGILKCRVLQTYYGLTVLNQLKRSDKIYHM